MTDLKNIIENNIQTNWKNILLSQNYDDVQPILNSNFYPSINNIFKCFNYFNVEDTKVVILGMDPYINAGEAMGLSFSVPDNIKIPPSLKNIYKEINSDLEIDITQRTGNLEHWAQQGILLLNSALTVQAGKSGSHLKYWSKITNNIIDYISENCEHVVFILWGQKAKDKSYLIDSIKHHIIEGAHPSPLSVKNFYGGKYFSKCNDILTSWNIAQIQW